MIKRLKPSTIKKFNATMNRAENALNTAEATIKKLDSRLAIALALFTEAQLAEYIRIVEREEMKNEQG